MGVAKLSPNAETQHSLTHQTQQLRRNLQTPIPATRVALERKISLKFPHFRGFLTETSSNISITGMFIQTTNAQAPGTLVEFEFALVDGLELIRGRGEVVWARRQNRGTGQPPGMGVRFLRLDAKSRRLIRWAVEKQIAEGTEPFDLEDRPMQEANRSQRTENVTPLETPKSPSPATSSDIRKLPPYAGYAMVKGSKWWVSGWRQPWPVIVGGAVVLGVLLLALSWPLTSRESSTPSQQQAGLSPSPEAVSQNTSARQTAAPVDDAPQRQMYDMTEHWATAWAEQRPADYVGFYSQHFEPPHAMGRKAWETLRARRIRSPKFIQVGISNLESQLLAPDRGLVTFDQSYRSDNFRDNTRKTLELVLEDNEWKIVAERISSREALAL